MSSDRWRMLMELRATPEHDNVVASYTWGLDFSGTAVSAVDAGCGAPALQGAGGIAGLLAAWPVDLPRNWTERVNRPETETELAAVRQSVMRGAPFGSLTWSVRTAAAFGLDAVMRPRGRPRKEREK